MADAIFTYSEQLQGRDIRVLQLGPASSSSDGELCCSLIVRSLDEIDEFYAISYVWGDDKDRKWMRCNGKRFLIPSSLHLALRHFNDKLGGCLLWADSICVNQQNDEEKTAQVRIMEDIYHRAKTVLIWLGEEQPGDASAYALAVDLGKQLGNVITDTPRALQIHHDLKRYDVSPEIQVLIDRDDDWTHLDNLLSRPWFSRVWVIQEVVLAQKAVMFSGSLAMDPIEVLNIGTLLAMHRLLQGRLYREEGVADTAHVATLANVDALARLISFRRLDITPDLQTILGMTRNAQASDARDRLFALVSLCSDVPRDIIDYGQSQVEVALRTAMRLLFQAPSPVFCLGWAQVMRNGSPLPSWAADWTREPIPMQPMSTIVQPDSFKDYGDAHVEFVVPEEGEDFGTLPMLKLRGVLLDTLCRLVEQPLGLDQAQSAQMFKNHSTVAIATETTYKWMRGLLDAVELQSEYVAGGSAKEALWRALICNGAPYEYPAPATWGGVFDLWVSWMRDWPLRQRQRDQCDAEQRAYPPDFVADWDRLNQIRVQCAVMEGTFGTAAAGRRFAFTSADYLGWVPNNARVDDVVVALPGCHTPFVLRRAIENDVDDGEGELSRSVAQVYSSNQWILIGDCYIHGLMHDEFKQTQDSVEEDMYII